MQSSLEVLMHPSRLRRLAAPTLGLVFLGPLALFIAASVLKYAVGLPSLYDGLGFFADPQRLPWYDQISPVLFLGGPLAAIALSLGTILRLDLRRETGQVITTVTLTPRLFNLAVAIGGVALLAVLGCYLIAENFRHA
jgi:hypothetical protein